MLRHPIILLALAAFFEASAVLLFPGCFYLIIALVLTAVIVFIALGIGKNSISLTLTVCAILIFSAVNPYVSYIRNEKAAQSFVQEHKNSEDTEFVAVVTECNTHQLYTQIFARLVAADRKPLEKHYKIRIGSFSSTYLSKGDIVVFKGIPLSLSEIPDDGFNTSAYLRGRSVFIDFPNTGITSSYPGNRFSLIEFLRSYTRFTIYRYFPRQVNSDNKGLSLALFMGQKDVLSKNIKRTFSECSLTHLVCVSGLHLSIVAGFLHVILCLLSVPKKPRYILLAALCIFYTAFTGFSISTIRACIMCLTVFAGELLGRRTNALRSLFFSMLVIVMLSPYSVFDVSAALSFTATLGIICASRLIPVFKSPTLFKKLITGLCGIILPGVGAVAFTLPLCAYYFSEISTVSVPATLILSVIIEALLTSLLFLILLSPLSFIPFIESLLFSLGEICNFLGTVITYIAEFFASFRFSGIQPVLTNIFLWIFCVLIAFTAVMLSFRFKKCAKIMTCAIIALSFILSSASLCFAVYSDGFYKVYYYRKNENNRQLSVKLAADGYLLVNADSHLCTDYEDIPFDYKGGRNHLLIIPDSTIVTSILADSIISFHESFGLISISVPATKEGSELAEKLSDYGIKCSIFPGKAELSSVTVTLTVNNGYYLSVDADDVKTGILFSDNYSADSFENDCDICAFFTRKTKNQFDISNDTPPECDVFITRLKKGEKHDGFFNTFGEKSVIIKG